MPPTSTCVTKPPASGRCSACISASGYRWSRCGRLSFTAPKTPCTAKLSSGTACARGAPLFFQRWPPPDAIRLRQGPGPCRSARHGRKIRRRARLQHRQCAARSPIGIRRGASQICTEADEVYAHHRDYLPGAGGVSMGPKMYFGFYLDMPPITQVTAKAQRVLKFKPTDFASGLQETYKWYCRDTITLVNRIIRSKTCC